AKAVCHPNVARQRAHAVQPADRNGACQVREIGGPGAVRQVPEKLAIPAVVERTVKVERGETQRPAIAADAAPALLRDGDDGTRLAQARLGARQAEGAIGLGQVVDLLLGGEMDAGVRRKTLV